MKTYLSLSAILMIFTWNLSFGNPLNDAYLQAMSTEISKLYQAASVEELQKSANAFQRISTMNPTEWLPDYYAAWAYANMGFRSQGSAQDKDNYFAQAKKLADKAAQVSPNNSEIVAMQGYITMGELSVDPGSRGQHLSPVAMQTFGKAINLNRTNPRAILLMAQMEYGMAQFFGQGPEKACGLILSSLELFKKEAATAKNNSIEPLWGEDYAKGLYQELCGN
jgi:tetratricopeptide (TPR) repeat protein